MQFLDSPEAVRIQPALAGYLPVIERAWQSLKLDGVLFAHGRPILYLKEFRHALAPHERIHWHRLFWNQGVANVLVLADPSNVYIYSALARPLQDDSITAEQALVATLTQAEYAQGARAFLAALDTGTFYREHKNHFQPQESVDAYLLKQLKDLRNELCGGKTVLPVAMAHAFLGRLLFVCYLLDREIITLDDGAHTSNVRGAARLTAILEQKGSFSAQREFLYGWFTKLKEQFNGTMFDQDLAAECAALRPPHMEAVTHFLGGHEIRGGQRTLGFWAYDFKIIPVETISAIYESFLAGENTQAKRKGGAFYTPRFLAEMVLDVVTEGGVDITTKRCLDPACGSGIFLVALFSRMATAWLSMQPGKPAYVTRAKAFQRILREQIRGIDHDKTACRIACFSLYLAYLDRLAPPDIGEHARKTGKALPKLMSSDSIRTSPSDTCIPVVLHADTLTDVNDLNGTFDVVVGNPPWKERPEKLAQRFTEKASDFLRHGGTGCLLLPTALLLNKTDNFQARWLRRVTLERIVNLADYSFLLFQNAKRPALIARFRNNQPLLETATVEHDAPKFRRDTLREGCITISPPDRSWIPQRNILAAAQAKTAPLLWKRHLWGTPRDQKLLDLLLDMPTLGEVAGHPRQKKRWIEGQGFQPNTSGKSKAPQNPWWKPTSLFIPARSAILSDGGLVLLKDDCEPIGQRFSSLHRPRDRRIYDSPMVLVSKGFGKIAFCDFPVLFQDAILSIKGSDEDEYLLMFLAAYLRSPLAQYFAFHTAGNWGTERDIVQTDELMQLPFPLPDSEFASAQATRIVRDVAGRMRALRERISPPADRKGRLWDSPLPDKERRRLTDTVQKELNSLVYRYFGLTPQEIVLVEDTTEVFIPSSTPSTWWEAKDKSKKVFTLDPVQKTKLAAYQGGIAVYAKTLTETLNGWAAERNSPYRVSATGGCDAVSGLAMVTLHLTEAASDFRPADVSNTLWRALDSYRQRAAKQRQGGLAIERDIVLFQGSQIHIVRPDLLANWTRTAAMNDAARIYGEIITAGKAQA